MSDPFSVYNSKFTRKKGPTHLDWEESALGATDEPENFYEAHNSPNNRFFSIILLVVFAGLTIRLGALQLVNGAYYKSLAEGNRARTQEILAPRGIIYDSSNKQLVRNVPGFELTVTPATLPEDYAEKVKALGSVMGFDSNEILDKIAAQSKNSYVPISVQVALPHDQVLVFESQAKNFPGFAISETPIREYEDPLIFSHLLGYPGRINEKELALQDNYSPQDYIGKTGIEFSYEEYLKGVNGKKQVEVDAQGNVKADLGMVPPQIGKSLVLNIDSELQRELHTQIVARNGGKKAAAVALNPQTGQILALVSLPGYDTNIFSRGIKQAEYQKLLNDPQNPLLNRTISGLYPPGSTIKPVVASAALQEGVVDENTTIFDNGDLVYNGFHFRGWKRDGLGLMNMRSAIAMSSDIYFYTIGGGQKVLGIEGLGPERMAKYNYFFGMGQKLGIDLPGEKAGIVASPEWRKSYYKDPELQVWYPGYTYHISIGQGDMTATPLQVAVFTSIVANGGTLYKPFIVDKVVDGEGKVILKNEPQVLRAGFIDAKNIQIVREGMRETVVSGTARSLNTLPIEVAGKTGTAQFDDSDPSATHAWFTAFAPYSNPQIVIVVLVEAGGEGSAAASPVVKETLKWWVENRYK